MKNLCCICQRNVPSFHNPDPIREDSFDCCDACNRLVIQARMKLFHLPEEEHEAYILRLRSMTYRLLQDEFG